MMLAIRIFASLFCASAVLLCQHAPLLTADQVADDGSHSFTVTNLSSATLTGMTVSFQRDLPGGGHESGKRFYDCLINLSQNPLRTGESYTFHLGGGTADTAPMRVSLEDAIFSDGTTFGDSSAIQSEWDRRLWLVAGFQEVFQHIDSEANDQSDKPGLISLLTRLRGTRLNQTSSREERASVGAAYDTLIGNLRDGVAGATDIISTIRGQETQRAKSIQQQTVPAGIRAQLSH